MGVDFDFYRKLNGLDSIPQDNGTEETTEILDRVGKTYWKSEKYMVSAFDVHKRSGHLDAAKHQRYTTISDIKVWVYPRKIKEPVQNSLVRGIQADLNQLKAGDYITYNDRYSGRRETYMLMSKPESQRHYEDAYMMFANEKLKWMNAQGVVKEYPCVVSHDKYTVGLATDGIIEREGSWVIVLCQANNDTLKIRTGDRFLFRAEGSDDFSVHEVLDTNPHSISGLIYIKVQAAKLTSDDNIELGIANYYSKVPVDVTVPVETLIVGASEIFIGTENIYLGVADHTLSLAHVSGTLNLNQYLTQASVNGDLSVTSIATSGSVGFEFDVVLTRIADSVVVETKRVKVTGW